MSLASLVKRLPDPQPYICRQCVRKQIFRNSTQRRAIWAASNRQQDEAWSSQAHRIRIGTQKSMLSLLEERGFVKDIAGGRNALDWLLTEKPIGAYVGVDPTAPSLHAGHLLPLMALFWMYLHGFYAVTLLGDGTVKIGDPSGRTTARTRQSEEIHRLNIASIHGQLKQLWTNVKALGIKHNFSKDISRQRDLLRNESWLKNLSAIDLMRGLGSGMRLGTMLSRDSVKLRMEGGEGMAVSEFSYPLFQGYDWWHMYSNHGVQMQLGGSDQYGNICAGMDAISHMRTIELETGQKGEKENPLEGAFGLTTPLLTTASGEKFGKSAGNAVWLDRDMLSSFDLYQYFLRTADEDVERYLKLFTFLPIGSIDTIMSEQQRDASKRIAQHLLAKEIVELAHGAEAARQAAVAHREAFSHGTNFFSLFALRTILHGEADSQTLPPKAREQSGLERDLLEYKKECASNSSSRSPTLGDKSSTGAGTDNVVTLPNSLLSQGSFPQVLHAAGLVTSKSEGHRLIKSRGAYVVIPNSGSSENANNLTWAAIPESVASTDPNHYLIDFEALVLRAGKAKIQVCRIVNEDAFESEGHSCPGWEDFKVRRAASHQHQ